jgi:hypothetical protein
MASPTGRRLQADLAARQFFLIDVKTLPVLRAPYIEKRVVTFKDIEAARDRIAGAVYYSPCQHSISLSETLGMKIFCKLDNLQRTGSFKGTRRAQRPRTTLARPKETRRDCGLGWQPCARSLLPG